MESPDRPLAAAGVTSEMAMLAVSSISLRGAVDARAECPEVAEEAIGVDEVGGVLVGDVREDLPGQAARERGVGVSTVIDIRRIVKDAHPGSGTGSWRRSRLRSAS